MINLFNINYYTIDTSKFSNLFDEEQNKWSANQRLIDKDEKKE